MNVNSTLFGIGWSQKNYFSFTNIFTLRLFKMIANQVKCSRLEQRSIIKFLLAENCKPCEIYRRICDVYGEARFIKKKMFTNRLNMSLPQRGWVEKTVHGVETHSQVKIVPGAAVSKKKRHADCHLEHERTHHYWFFLKVLPIANSLDKIHLIYWIILVNTYIHTYIHTYKL